MNMKDDMQSILNYLVKELEKIRAGKANVKMLEGIKIDYYGTMTPIEQVASLTTPDPKQIAVQPWEKNLIPLIEKAVMSANLGFNPQNNGETIRIMVPALTEERRKDLVKKVKQEIEQAKINIRNIRRNVNAKAKELKDSGVSEDEIKKMETEVQKVTDEFIAKADKYSEIKEKEIMTI
jgi:ribosome recycling factor